MFKAKTVSSKCPLIPSFEIRRARWFPIIVTTAAALLFSLSSLAQDAAAAPNASDKLGLQALIDQAIAHDPKILRLKRQIDIERSRAKLVAPPNNPELRLGYSHGSDAATPRPFTEVEEETITRSGSRSDNLNRNESSRGSETRNGTESRTGTNGRNQSFNEKRNSSENSKSSERESGSFRETVTRITRSEVTPTKRGEIVRQTVEERSNGSFSEKQGSSESFSGRESRNGSFNGSNGRGTNNDAFNTSGSENGTRNDSGSNSSRVISESVSERSFDRDDSDGSDEFSAQIRLFPRNPWEKAAQKERAEGNIFRAQFIYDTAVLDLSQEVRETYTELQFLREQVGLTDNKMAFLEKEITFHKKLFEAGRGGADDVVRTQIDAMNVQKERREVEDTLFAGKASLAAMAHLDDAERIDLGDATTERTIEIDQLEVGQLLEAAMFAHSAAGLLSLEQRLIRKDMAIIDADKYPWFTLLSASYSYEERFDHKYQDEFSVVAGLTLPIFDWFGKTDKTEPHKLEIQALEDQRSAIQEKLKYKIMLALARLKKTRSSADEFIDEYTSLKSGILAMKSKLESVGGGLDTNKQLIALERHLVELDTRALAVGQDYASALLRFERMLGIDLDALGK